MLTPQYKQNRLSPCPSGGGDLGSGDVSQEGGFHPFTAGSAPPRRKSPVRDIMERRKSPVKGLHALPADLPVSLSASNAYPRPSPFATSPQPFCVGKPVMIGPGQPLIDSTGQPLMINTDSSGTAWVTNPSLRSPTNLPPESTAYNIVLKNVNGGQHIPPDHSGSATPPPLPGVNTGVRTPIDPAAAQVTYAGNAQTTRIQSKDSLTQYAAGGASMDLPRSDTADSSPDLLRGASQERVSPSPALAGDVLMGSISSMLQ